MAFIVDTSKRILRDRCQNQKSDMFKNQAKCVFINFHTTSNYRKISVSKHGHVDYFVFIFMSGSSRDAIANCTSFSSHFFLSISNY